MGKGKHRKRKLHGHYCKICGEYRANEKFSGKGHASHICKDCARLSSSERAEKETLTKLGNLLGKRLNETERNCLNRRVHDPRPEVADTAREIRNLIFPFAERNERKRKLDIAELIFEVHTEVYDEYGDSQQVNQRFEVKRGSGIIIMTAFDCNNESREQAAKVGKEQERKLLRWIVHTLEIFMWSEDFCLNRPDPDLDLLPEYRQVNDWGELDENQGDENRLPLESETEDEPCWQVQIVYCTGEEQKISCYLDYLPGRAEELYQALMEFFTPEDDEDFDFDDGEELTESFQG